MFSEHTILHPDPKIPTTKLDGEIVLMNFETDSYYSLAGTAAAVWSALTPGATLQNICQAVLRDYTLDEETCRRDVSDFLTLLMQHKIIRTAEA